MQVDGRLELQVQPTPAVVIPVKAFGLAKRRLADVLDPAARADLARSMAETVIAAAGQLQVIVVCDDDAVRSWAEGLGVEVVWTPGVGLNGAVEAGVAHLAAQGVRRAIVAHADLPLATDLAWVNQFSVARGGIVAIVPDRHGDGTNVIALPSDAGFRFAYGPGSCERHQAEAMRLELAVAVVHHARLGWDVDRPEDLDLPTDLELDAADAPCP
jgi:2-phospho-L-lactate/phosphoenolpyruvate guanylyltransferase